MFPSSFVLSSVTLAAAGLGFMGIAWTRCGGGAARACWGKRIFFAMLSVLAVGTLAGAWQPQSSFLHAGLAIGGLLITMLWESPSVSRPESGVRSQPTVW